jgi:hypothetical protein
MSVTIRLWAFYELSADSTGATGLTVAVDVDKVAKAAGTVTRVTTGGSAAEMANGVYSYAVANVADLDTYDYVGVFKTAATTVKSKHVPSLQQDLIAGLTTLLSLVDVAVSTRLAAASYSAAPTAAANADAVWDELIAGHAIATSTGALLSSAGAAADPLLNAVPGAYTAPQAGYYLGRLANNAVSIASVFKPETMELSYYYGDDYLHANGRHQDFTTTYTLTGGSVALVVRNASALVSIPCSIPSANVYRLELTAENLEAITPGVWDYDLQMTLPTSSNIITEVYGKIMVTADVR